MHTHLGLDKYGAWRVRMWSKPGVPLVLRVRYDRTLSNRRAWVGADYALSIEKVS
jgi:hypothetical protein